MEWFLFCLGVLNFLWIFSCLLLLKYKIFCYGRPQQGARAPSAQNFFFYQVYYMFLIVGPSLPKPWPLLASPAQTTYKTLFKFLKQGRFRSRPRVGHAYAQWYFLCKGKTQVQFLVQCIRFPIKHIFALTNKEENNVIFSKDNYVQCNYAFIIYLIHAIRLSKPIHVSQWIQLNYLISWYYKVPIMP